MLYVISYERFLYLVAKQVSQGAEPPAHPTYIIDLIWHAHMLHPIGIYFSLSTDFAFKRDKCSRIDTTAEYQKDIAKWTGLVLDHDPWPKLSEAQLEEQYARVKAQWMEEYNVDLERDHEVLPSGPFEWRR